MEKDEKMMKKCGRCSAGLIVLAFNLEMSYAPFDISRLYGATSE